jgi:hypothetical protein
MWEAGRLAALLASGTFYRNIFTFLWEGLDMRTKIDWKLGIKVTCEYLGVEGRIE